MKLVDRTLVIDDSRAVTLSLAQVRVVAPLLRVYPKGLPISLSPYVREHNGLRLIAHLRRRLRSVGADVKIDTEVALVSYVVDGDASLSRKTLGVHDDAGLTVDHALGAVATKDATTMKAIDSYRRGQSSLSDMLDALYPATARRAG